MRRFTSFLSILVLFALVLGACSNADTTAGVDETTGEDLGTAAATLEVEPVETESELPGTGGDATEAVDATESPAETEVMEETAEMTEEPEATEAVTAEATAEATASPVMTDTGVMTSTVAEGLIQASQLIGQEVSDANGQTVGQIDELAVHLGTGQVEYVILLPTGAEEGVDQYVPVPWRGFNWSAETPTLTVLTDTISSAPVLDLRAVPVLIPDDWQGEFGAFWEGELGPAEEPAEEEAAPTPEPTAEATAVMTGTAEGGAATPEATAAATAEPTAVATEAPTVEATEAVTETEPNPGMDAIVLTSTILDRPLQTAGGAEAGTVTDLVIDLSSGEALAVLASVGEEGNAVPIPLSVLSRNIGEGAFTVPVEMDILQTVPPVDMEGLSAMTGEELQNTLNSFWQSAAP